MGVSVEASVVLSLHCNDKSHRDFISLMLSDDPGRPLFEEDVAESERDWFKAMEDIDSAEWVEKKNGNIIHAGWTIGGWEYESDIKETIGYLTSAGLEDIRIVIVGDEGWYQLLMLKKGNLKQYDSWQGKELGELFDGVKKTAEVLDSL